MSADLHRAIEADDLDSLARLLATGDDPNEIRDDWAPLHDAVRNVEAVALLLRHGANPNIWDSHHNTTPLLSALFLGHHDAALMLLAAGADPNVRSGEGEVPISMCVEQGDLKMAATLLRAGATKSMHESTTPTGMNALGHAADRIDIEMITLLLSWGASTTLRDTDRHTARDRLPKRTGDNAERWDLAFALLSPKISV